MEEGSNISAGSCLGKVFLLLMDWESREIEKPDSHSLTLGSPSCSVGQICPFLPQFPHSSWALLPARERRAKPLLGTLHAGGSLSHTTWHMIPLLGLPALLLSGDLEVSAKSNDRIPGPSPSTISQTTIQHHISSSQPWFSRLRDS